MNDVAVLYAVIAVSVVVVLYFAWKQHRDHDRWQRKHDQQDLVLEIQRELHRHQTTVLSRCTELERELRAQRRTLRYVAQRLT